MAEQYLMWPIQNLIPWEDNPRLIQTKNFEKLKNTLKEEGQDKPIIVDTREGNYGKIISGNMTYRALKELGKTEVWVHLKTTRDDAHFFKLAIEHNMTYGEYEPTKLAELADLYKDSIRLDELDIHLSRPIDLGFHLQNISPPSAPPDVDTTDEKLDTYMNNAIKQIVLYFKTEQYADVLERLNAIGTKKGLENNTDIFMELLNNYESTTQNSGDQPESA